MNDINHVLYEARKKIGKVIIFKATGKELNDLKITLATDCELERSGAEGEIIELGTKEVVYSCRKQTIIDE
ncbi:TPA: hypothetical protein JA969_12450 [Legionella pneumophila]|nr:hypothetical protein [Legionella pneumophila]HAT8583829.1 hypothetical protein [Legionella pneumophila]